MNAAELNAFAAVAMILKRYNIAFSKERLIRLCHGHPSFPTLLSVSDLLKKFGFRVNVRRVDLTAMTFCTAFPALVFVKIDGGKLMLFESIDKSCVYLTDPQNGRIKMASENFSDNWDGIIFDLNSQFAKKQNNTFSNIRIVGALAFCVCLLFFIYHNGQVDERLGYHLIVTGSQSLIAVMGCYVSARMLSYIHLLAVYEALDIGSANKLPPISKQYGALLEIFLATVTLPYFVVCLLVNLETGAFELGIPKFFHLLCFLVICGTFGYFGPYSDRHFVRMVRLICLLTTAMALLDLFYCYYFDLPGRNQVEFYRIAAYGMLATILWFFFRSRQPLHQAYNVVARQIAEFKHDPARIRAIGQQERSMAPLFDDMHVYTLDKTHIADVLTIVVDPRYDSMPSLLEELLLVSDTFEDVRINLVFSYVAPFPDHLRILKVFESIPASDFESLPKWFVAENQHSGATGRELWTEEQRQLIRNHFNWSTLSGIRNKLHIFFNDRPIPDYIQVDDLLNLIRGLKNLR